MIHNMHWYVLNLAFAEGKDPGGAYLWLTHPNCGRIRNTKPRKKPERNPPIWAKLSTCGSIPTAKLIAMMITRVTNAANWKTITIIWPWVSQLIYHHQSLNWKPYNTCLISINCPISDEFRKHSSQQTKKCTRSTDRYVWLDKKCR